MKTRRLIGIIVSVAMIVCTLPLGAIPAFAAIPTFQDNVTMYYCLEVGAGAYIDTEFVPNENTRIVMDCEVKKEDTALFGTFLDWGYNNYNLFYVNSNKDFLGSGSGMNSQAWACSLQTGRRTIELAGKELKYGDTTVCTHNGAYASFGNHTAYLFAINFGSWVQIFENQRIRFYSCQIYEGDTLVRNFVPAKKDNKLGLYDWKTFSFFEFKGDGTVIPYNKVISNPQSVLPGSNEGVILDFDGTITVSQNTEINASPLQSGIAVAYGRNVTIDIKDGVTLKVTGGTAEGTIGGGAGIEVPENSTLTLCGFGTLEVTGGMAAIGGNGEGGDDGLVDGVTADCYSGKGGDGGDGGGGAGAGIGGRGGRGGLGSKGGDSVVGATAIAGLDGSAGLGGEAGEGCGNITVAKTFHLTAKGGAACNTQATGGLWGDTGYKDFSYCTYLAFGGGGGGAGGSGYGGAKIGSGGYGGCGGGGGGSGSDEWFVLRDKINGCVAYGLPGGGGAGYVNGENGKGFNIETRYTDGYDPGNGGAGGNYGSVAADDRTGKEKEPEYFYAIAAIPQAAENLTYNGEVQNGIINLSDLNDKYTLSGDVSATNVGTYFATFSLKDNCIWSDGTFDNKIIEWSIAEKKISVPQAEANLTYNGKERFGVPAGEGYDIFDNKGTNVGNYTAKAVLKYGYCWSDGTHNDKTIDWSIAEHIISVPQVNANLTYNGKEQFGVPANEGYDIFDNAKTNVGNYTAKAVLKYGYCWEDGTYNDKTFDWSIAKQKVTVSSETIYVHYNTAERYVLRDTDLYTVENGTVPACYTGKLYPRLTLKDTDNYMWENSDEATIDCHIINVHKYSKGDTGCSICGKSEQFCYDVISYLDKTVTGDNTVVTEEKKCVNEIYITEDDKEWGFEELSTVWYVAKGDIELKYRPEVKGDIRIILMEGATLTANHGITVEEGNTLRIYAQSDEESKMGKLIAETKGVTAIGGRNGNNAPVLRFSWDVRRGGDGGTGGNVYFYGGKISLKSEDIATVGGGHGGRGGICWLHDQLGDGNVHNGGDGGNGGSSGKVYFYGGNVLLQNNNAACIGGGNGGDGGDICEVPNSDSEIGPIIKNTHGNPGRSGSLTDGFWNVYGMSVIKAGDNADNAGIIDKNDGYNGQKYLSVKYHKWDNYSLATHKCDICGEEEEHNDDGNGICTICGNKIIEIIAKEAATYEKPGHLAYYPFNGNYYSDPDYTNQITNLTKWLNTNVEDGGGMIPAIGHIVYMGSSVISVNDNICYGDQKKWRVLSKNGNTTDSDGSTAGFSDGTNQVSKDNALFVISENDFGYRQFNSNGNQNWQLSDAQKWCNEGGFYTDAGITTAEQNAILTTSKSDAAYSSFNAADNILNDKVFYLSANETATYFNDVADRQLKPDGSNESVRWWLRSPSCTDDVHVQVGMVSTLGNISDIYSPNISGVSRPAFNLNSEYILFTSAADFTSEGIGNEWKLTLLDENRAFAIDNVTKNEDILTVAYTGAKTGDNEIISYVITDNSQNVIKYHGGQTVTNADGSIEIMLPYMAADDRLFVFNQQDNGAKRTNYASELKEVPIPNEPVTYLGWDDENKMPFSTSTSDYAIMTDGMQELNGGWYVVNGNVTVNDRIYAKGDVHLILCDGAKLTAKTGINVPKDGSLTIYGQEKGTGELNATGQYYRAGIGGGVSTGAGVNSDGNSGSITINGGNIRAQGDFGAAGIGAGLYGVCGKVTINGGNVTAIGGYKCAGITNGSGAAQEGTNLAIGDNMIILAGKTEVGMELLSLEEYKSNINIIEGDNEQKYVCITSYSYNVTESDINYIDPTNDIPSQSTDKYIALDENSDLLDSRISGDVWFVVDKNITIPNRITVIGNVNLLLCDGATLTAQKGISVQRGNSLTVYGQESGTGELTATADVFYAGIGGDNGVIDGFIVGTGNSGSITVNGGKIRAQGGFAAAGIGGGHYGVSGSVTVNGGDVTAIGGQKCAGITNGSGADVGADLAIGNNMLIFAGNTEDGMKPVSIDEYKQNINIIEVEPLINDQKYVHIYPFKHEAKAATCKEPGHLAYYKYEGKYYKDGDLKDEIEDLTAWLDTEEKDGGGMLPATGKHTDSQNDGICDECGKEFVNMLSLEADGNKFTVKAIGKDAGYGVVVVALYDNENMINLLDVKTFDLATKKAENISFGQDGYIKAYWWSDLDDIIPFYEAKELLWSNGKPCLIEN